MTALDTRYTRLGAVVQHETLKEYGFCRATVIAREGNATKYTAGTVLGKVTGTGKYAVLEASASDGSQNFAGIYVGSAGLTADDFQTIAATTDTSVVVLVRGPAIVGEANLKFGVSVDTQGERDAIYAQMDAVGIRVVDQPDHLTTNN